MEDIHSVQLTVVHMKSDRTTCVKNEKRELEFKPWLLSYLHTAAIYCLKLFWKVTKIVGQSLRLI